MEPFVTLKTAASEDENEKKNKIKEGMQHGSVYAVYIMHAIHDSLRR